MSGAASVSQPPSAVYETYLREKAIEFQTKSDMVNQSLVALRAANTAAQPVNEYAQDIDADLATLQRRRYELHSEVRQGRRRFMDDDPQGGVSGILGLRTTDDKILLAFWIVFGVWVGVALFIALGAYGEALGINTIAKKIGAIAGTYAATFYTAWYFIAHYA